MGESVQWNREKGDREYTNTAPGGDPFEAFVFEQTRISTSILSGFTPTLPRVRQGMKIECGSMMSWLLEIISAPSRRKNRKGKERKRLKATSCSLITGGQCGEELRLLIHGIAFEASPQWLRSHPLLVLSFQSRLSTACYSSAKRIRLLPR